MKRRDTIIVLAGLALLLLLLAGRQSYQLFHALHHLNAPTPETREPFGRNIHGWMSIEEVAECYNVSTSAIFKALDIDPAPGDEKLTLKALGDKYNKTGPEMEKGLSKLGNNDPSRGKDGHG